MVRTDFRRADGHPPRTTSSRDISPVTTTRFERLYLSQPATSDTTTDSSSPSTDAFERQFFLNPNLLAHKQDTLPAVTFLDTSDLEEEEFKDMTSPNLTSSFDDDSDIDHHPDNFFAQFRSSGDLAADVGHTPPTPETLARAYEIPLYDGNGECRPFGHIWDPSFAPRRRQLVVFVRHFFCGACSAYLKALARSISMREYYRIPIPTSIVVIGCGQPHMIRHYQKFTSCPFPIFADPSRQLYKLLGMHVTMAMGHSPPEYMKGTSAISWLGGQFATVGRSLKDPEGIRKRDVINGGWMLQIGGEFLFDEGEVTWCHRMRHMRNHAEIDVVRRQLGLDV